MYDITFTTSDGEFTINDMKPNSLSLSPNKKRFYIPCNHNFGNIKLCELKGITDIEVFDNNGISVYVENDIKYLYSSYSDKKQITLDITI